MTKVSRKAMLLKHVLYLEQEVQHLLQKAQAIGFNHIEVYVNGQFNMPTFSGNKAVDLELNDSEKEFITSLITSVLDEAGYEITIQKNPNCFKVEIK